MSMGWSLNPYVFQNYIEGFTIILRDPESLSGFSCTPRGLGPKALKKYRRRRRVFTRARLLTFVDDFAMFAYGYYNKLNLKERTFKLLNDLGLKV